MSEAEHPLDGVDPNALTMLFDVDPTTLPPNGLDNLIAEYRRRADVAKAEAAAQAAAPKTAKGRAKKSDPMVDAALASIADKPIAELDLDDLLPGAQV